MARRTRFDPLAYNTFMRKCATHFITFSGRDYARTVVYLRYLQNPEILQVYKYSDSNKIYMSYYLDKKDNTLLTPLTAFLFNTELVVNLEHESDPDV